MTILSTWRSFLLSSGIVFSAVLLVASSAYCMEKDHDPVAVDWKASLSDSDAIRKSVARASPGLVTIYTLRGPRMTHAWQRYISTKALDFAGSDPSESGIRSQAIPHDEQGSGIVIDSQGTILTCNHVVDSADAVIVVLPDGRKYEPSDIRGDRATDLALLRIEGMDEIDQVELGDSDSVKIGDWVVSLGSPYDLNLSASFGMVSSIDRRMDHIRSPMIQNDAATNPGSSGGALLNLKGEVIGILSAGIGDERCPGFHGIGLAIPVNTVKELVQKLDKPERAKTFYLGCQTHELSPAMIKRLELPITGGLYVKDIQKHSPAEESGILVGDIITHVSGHSVGESERLQQLLTSRYSRHKRLSLRIFRDGKPLEIALGLGTQVKKKNSQHAQLRNEVIPRPRFHDERLRIGFDKLTIDLARQLNLPQETKGILITEVEKNTPAYINGIAAGMVVLRVNNEVIRSTFDFKRAMRICPKESPIMMLVQSDVEKYLIVFD